VADATLAPLPRGRHSLSRQQVADSQRLRLAIALADAMAVHGYVGTPVAAIIEGAGVSRETFYRLYDSKLACFLDALDFVGEVLLAELGGALDSADPMERASTAVGRYLDTIVDHPAFARLFLVEVHAAGPEAMRRRAALQDQVVQALAHLLGARSTAQRFACRAYVAAVSSMVTRPIVEADEAAIRDLRRPLLAQLRTLVEPL
jgi:AcrR family transcriptional regulator